MKQGYKNTRAACPDRMAEGDRATIDVYLFNVPAKVPVHGAGLGGESLVRFDEVKILGAPAGLLQRLAARRNGPGAHIGGIDPGLGPGNNPRQRLDATPG